MFTEDLGNDVLLEMVLIPGGKFMMGSPEDELERRDDESPQHEVNIKPFCMGKYPITQDQWKAVAALPQVNIELKPDPSRFKGSDRPVEQVSWYEAVEFCDRLTHHTKRQYRLPSEAEWEYACRAGTTTPFHFGETITTDLVNYNGNFTYGNAPTGIYRQQTTDVDNFPPNAFGLYDMHGNVWEWCADSWHSNYEGAPNDGSVWENGDDEYRVLRGGSWFSYPWSCRSAYRSMGQAQVTNSYASYGFRVVSEESDTSFKGVDIYTDRVYARIRISTGGVVLSETELRQLSNLLVQQADVLAANKQLKFLEIQQLESDLNKLDSERNKIILKLNELKQR